MKKKKKQQMPRWELFVIGLLLGALILFIIAAFYNPSINKSGQTTTSYPGLSPEEIELVRQYTDDVNPDYVILAKDIQFEKNYSGPASSSGLNLNGHIKIDFNPRNMCYVRRTLCHELLHQLVTGADKDKDEQFVRDLSQYYPCYTDRSICT